MRNKLLAVSGSLRDRSSSTALLHAAAALAPEHWDISFYSGLAELPHFNPDMDGDDGHPAVTEWRRQLREADGVLFCTPEYANGVPGSLKNALDWIVSSGEFMNKPTAVISASPHPLGGEKALESLLLTLKMMDARIVEGATLKVPFIGRKLDAEGGIKDPETEQAIRSLLNAFSNALPAAD